MNSVTRTPRFFPGWIALLVALVAGPKRFQEQDRHGFIGMSEP